MERKDILQRKRDFVAKYAQYWNVPLIPIEQLRELLARAQKEMLKQKIL